jgi:hypothetical protein
LHLTPAGVEVMAAALTAHLRPWLDGN